jgi:cytochrome c2
MDGTVNRALLFLTGAAALLVASCKPQPTPGPTPATSVSIAPAAVTAVTTSNAAAVAPALDEAGGDAEKGKALVAQFECARCHAGTGTPPALLEKACFGCHVKIISGEFKSPKAVEARWRERVVDLKEVPSLTSSQQRFRRSWLISFLLDPHDLRPRLGPTMPRLAISREQARDIAAFLGAPESAAAKPDFSHADPVRGRKLMEANGCPSCHVFTGVPALEGASPVRPGERNLASGMALAPDLRFARERLRPEALISWVTNPKKVKPDTAMPEFDLPADDARDIAAYILGAELAPPPPYVAPVRLPLLDRKVGYDEVSEKVFRRTCWHCHGEPDYAAGDGGPGNTGGFGFKPRGVSFVDYGSIQAGRTDDAGERHSLFEKAADGTPRLVRALLARRDEEAGHADAQIRGMPLGYPSLTAEEVQLVETWVSQGRPR